MNIHYRKGNDHYMIEGHTEVRKPNEAFAALGAHSVTVGVIDSVTHLSTDNKCSPRSKREFQTALALFNGQITHIPWCEHAPRKGDRCTHHCGPSKEFADNANRETLILKAFEAAQVF